MGEVQLFEELELYYAERVESQAEHPFIVVADTSLLYLPGSAADWLGAGPPAMVGFYHNRRQKTVDVRGFNEPHSQYHINNPELFDIQSASDDFGYYVVKLPTVLRETLVPEKQKHQSRYILDWKPIWHEAKDRSPNPVHPRVRLRIRQ